MVFLPSRWAVLARVYGAAILLLGTALFSGYELVKNTAGLAHGRDEVSAYEAHLAPARQFLPPHGVICYLPDPNSSDAAKKNFFLARYALAPLVLRTVPDCDPLLGDFPHGVTGLGTRYAVQRDFGNGVVLLKRNSQR